MNEKKPGSYRDLEIWSLARKLIPLIHRITLEKLPKFEMYEQASQIRRSSKSISSNIVEGYGRQRYKNEFIKFLTYALASCDETVDHLEILFDTGSLGDKSLYDDLLKQYNILDRKIYNFRQRVIEGHQGPKDQVGQQIFDDEDV